MNIKYIVTVNINFTNKVMRCTKPMHNVVQILNMFEGLEMFSHLDIEFVPSDCVAVRGHVVDV